MGLSLRLYAQRDLPIVSKRKLHIIGGARGLWALPIRQPVKASGISYEKAMNPHQTENDTLILSTDANPSPGVSRVGQTRSFIQKLSRANSVDRSLRSPTNMKYL